MRKESVYPVAAVAVAAVFAVLCAAVYLSRGNERLVLAKLRVGGLLLSLGWASSSGCIPVMTCYEPAGFDEIEVNEPAPVSYQALRVDLCEGKKVAGQITQRQSEAFSFQILAAAPASGEPTDEAQQIVQQGDLSARDGAYDEPQEEFELDLDEDLEPGTYELRFFNAALVAIEEGSWPQRTYTLTLSRCADQEP